MIERKRNRQRLVLMSDERKGGSESVKKEINEIRLFRSGSARRELSNFVSG